MDDGADEGPQLRSMRQWREDLPRAWRWASFAVGRHPPRERALPWPRMTIRCQLRRAIDDHGAPTDEARLWWGEEQWPAATEQLMARETRAIHVARTWQRPLRGVGMLATAVHIAMSWADQHVVSRCSAVLWREHTRRRMCWQGHLVLVFLCEESGWPIALFVGSNTAVRIVALRRTTARMCDDYREFARVRRLH